MEVELINNSNLVLTAKRNGETYRVTDDENQAIGDHLESKLIFLIQK